MDLKHLERHFYDVLDRQDWDTMQRELVSPEARAYAGGHALDRDGWREMGQMFYAGFPDGRHTIDDLVAEGDKVVMRGRFEGTHLGAFMGVPPTGRKISLNLITINRYDAQGRVVEHWGEFDGGGLIQQLGALPG